MTTSKQTYSFSRLDLYAKCPRAFFHKYAEGRPTPGGTPAKIGKIFHFAMKLVYGDGYSPSEAVYSSILEERGMPEGEFSYKLVQMVERAYYRVEQLFHNEESDVMTEQHIVHTITDGKEERDFQAYLDIIVDNPGLDQLILVDFKTTWQPFLARDSMQLAIYAHLFEQMRSGITAGDFRGRLIFPRCNRSEDNEVIFVPENVDRGVKWAFEQIYAIESRDPSIAAEWEMKSGKHCEYCPFVNLCSSGLLNNLPACGEPANMEEAQAIGQYLFFQEQAIKTMKNGLKSFVTRQKAPIYIEGGAWETVQGTSNPKVPTSILLQYAREHGKDPEEVLAGNNDKVAQWITEDTTGFLSSNATYTKPRSSFKFNPKAKASAQAQTENVGGETNE
ncbi:PD-(D/E)XK nuclease family protein [Aneurinibacillus tyrosinisolvens]|uniref:PD-(D/E)XK nuclease family protein n=1 Tax=Aneurinibacillus tyrosinisolvens TaxID=1443435 RepID=UPI00063FC230|nr:PD-(D/E)XK nuclease family protein [Aneurinibacillus tyrosinisolvens]